MNILYVMYLALPVLFKGTQGECSGTGYLNQMIMDGYKSDGTSNKALHNASIPPINGKTTNYRCLGMYQSDNRYDLDDNNLELHDLSSAKYGGHYISNALISDSGDNLQYGVAVLKETSCFEVEKLIKLIDNEDDATNMVKSITVTCPLGLLMDLFCVGCLNTACSKPYCSSSSYPIVTCSTGEEKVLTKSLCPEDRRDFLKSCFKDDSRYISRLEEIFNEIAPLSPECVSSPSTCSSVIPGSECVNCEHTNLIYQGLASLDAIRKDALSVECYDNSENVTLHCYEDGVPLSDAKWYLGSRDLGENAALVIAKKDLSNNDDIRCATSSRTVSLITGEHLLEACNAANGTVDQIEFYDDITPSEETPNPTSTTPTEAPKDPRSKRYRFFNDGTIWKPTTIFGMDAFNNPSRIQDAENVLSIATVSVNGRLTPVCGHRLSRTVADVHCRDVGLQVGKVWEASHYGIRQSSERESRPFYKHYLRNLNCTGNERNLIWCDHAGWFEQACRHDAVVVCREKVQDTSMWLSVWLYMAIVLACLIIAGIIITITNKALRVKAKETLTEIRSKMTRTKSYKSSTVLATFGSSTQDVELTDMHGSSGPESSGPEQPPPDFGNTISMGYSGSQDYSFSVGFSQSVSIKADEKVNNARGRVLKRLNDSTNLKEMVLLYQQLLPGGSFGPIRVCKTCIRSAEDREDNMVTEQYLLQHLHHDNIVKHVENPQDVDISETVNGIPLLHNAGLEKRHYMFFMEYLELGSLDTYLAGESSARNFDCQGHSLKVVDANSMIRGGTKGLKYLHDKGYVHSDLHTGNFMVFRNTKGLLDLKLGDFGEFYKVTRENECKLRSISGQTNPPRFVPRFGAPERFLNSEMNFTANACEMLDAACPYAADTWSWALVMWEISSWVVCAAGTAEAAARMNGSDEFLLDCGDESLSEMVIESRITYPGFGNVKCRDAKVNHIALVRQLNEHNSSVFTDRPDTQMMRDYYKEYYPTLSHLIFAPDVDKVFNWKIKECIDGCLRVNPAKRFSLHQILEMEAESVLQKSLNVIPERDVMI